MMKEVSDTAGETNMSRLLEFVVYNNSIKKWMHINISEWLSSMSDNVKIEVEEVINKHITQVQQVTESNNQMYSCLEPS